MRYPTTPTLSDDASQSRTTRRLSTSLPAFTPVRLVGTVGGSASGGGAGCSCACPCCWAGCAGVGWAGDFRLVRGVLAGTGGRACGGTAWGGSACGGAAAGGAAAGGAAADDGSSVGGAGCAESG